MNIFRPEPLELLPKTYLYGGITNGFLIFPDNTVIFLPYDSNRGHKTFDEVYEEIKKLLEGK